jgi:hypothetical protein
MRKLEILAEDGQLRRVTVERALESIEEAAKFQFALEHQLPELKPKSLADFHVTIFHFGKPMDLYSELQAVAPNLEVASFLDNLYTLLGNCVALESRIVEAPALGLRIFGGDDDPILVVELDQATGLAAEHQAVLGFVRSFIRQCGIVDADDFMLASYNLKYQADLQFRPHISLGHLPEDWDEATLAELPQPNFSVTLHPLNLRNVTVPSHP